MDPKLKNLFGPAEGRKVWLEQSKNGDLYTVAEANVFTDHIHYRCAEPGHYHFRLKARVVEVTDRYQEVVLPVRGNMVWEMDLRQGESFTIPLPKKLYSIGDSND